jgi:NADH-quinone oxidoreductase subunit K
MTAVPLWWYLALAAALFCIGLYAALSRRNMITMLMGIVMMLNGVIVNLAAFWRYLETGDVSGQTFALFVCFIAVAELAVGLALSVRLWRTCGTASPGDLDSLKG